jgi:hypothetical protein
MLQHGAYLQSRNLTTAHVTIIVRTFKSLSLPPLNPAIVVTGGFVQDLLRYN